jgi:dihydrofolate reductase
MALAVSEISDSKSDTPEEKMHQHLTSIVAIDAQGAIGCKNRLPWSIKSDMAFFRATTLHNAVIMGRRTYESIGGCLRDRKNLVLSHSAVLFESTENCKLVNSVDEALAAASRVSDGETFVIGGAATYSEFAPYVDSYLVTVVEHHVEDADAFLEQDILAEFGSWPSEEIGRYPATPGRDQFAFRILRYSAPDAAERAEKREAIARSFLSKRKNQPRSILVLICQGNGAPIRAAQ